MSTRGLVGRDAELARIDLAFAATREGRGRLVLLAGEPGIGKSTLARAAADRAAHHRVAWGRCWEQGGAPAFWPWIQILRCVRRELPELSVPEDVRRLLPELGVVTAQADRFLVFDAVQRYLAEAASDRPLLAVVEDLHAADQPSLALLAFITSQLASARLTIIATFRTAEARASVEVAAHLDRLARDAELITVPRLARAEVAALSGSLASETIDAVHHASGGNPLFVRELVRLVERDGQLAIPETLRAAIREHFRGLPVTALAIAGRCAVVGHEVSRGLLAELAGQNPDDDVAVLLAHGVLLESAPGRLGFSHGLYAEVLHDDLTSDERERLHRVAAELLEHVGAPMGEVTRHWFAAGATATPRAIETARRAAEEATHQLAFEDASQLLARALTVTPVDDVALRFELLAALVASQIQAGDGNAGKRTAAEAMTVARLLGAGDALGRAALAYGATFHVGVTDPTLVAWIDEALASLPEQDQPLRARLLARRASALQPADDPQGPIALARAAIEMARRLDDERTLLDVLHAAASALVNFAPPRECLDINRQTLELALRHRELGIALRARYRLILDHLRLGDMVGVARELRAYERLANEVRRPEAQAIAAQFRSLVALHAGRLDEHRHEAEAGRPLGIADAGFRMMSAIALGDDATMRANHAAWLALLASNHRVYCACCEPFLHARAGDSHRAHAALARVSAAEVVTFGDPLTMGWLAEAVALVRDREMAAVLLPGLERLTDRWGGAGMPALSLEPPISRVRGLLAACLGQRDRARGELLSAIAELRSAQLPVLLARTLLEWAETAPEVATPAEATAALAEARTLATSLGLPVIARIPASAPPTMASVDPLPSVSFVQDGDTWIITGPAGKVRVKQSRGVELLARLTADPTRELHVLDLVGGEAVDPGDSGELLDRTAIAAYRKRVLELRAELEDAIRWPESRRARAEAELESLEGQLRSAVGLGGRARRTTSASERARVNVQRRIADAIKHVTELAPEVGRHLAACVRTGSVCSYDPRRAR